MFLNKNISIFCGLLLLVAGCRKDASVTTYKDINEIKISGIEASYQVMQGEKLVIKPVLSFSMDDGKDNSRYEYEWFAADKEKTILSTNRDFDTEVNLGAGEHHMNFRVRDRQSGVQWSKPFLFNVLTKTSQGWLLLCDVGGTARLDMISLTNTGYAPIYDVLKVTGSKLKLQGAPVDIACFPVNGMLYGIYVSAAGTGTTRIDPESFDWKQEYYLSYETLMKDIPDNYLADFITAKGAQYTSFMYKNGNVYYYSPVNGLRFSVPINMVAGETNEFKAAPFAISSPGDFADYAPSVFYDADNKRFLQHANNKTNMALMPAGSKFDYNTGMDLVYMTSTQYNGSFMGGEVFAILKDGTGKYHLARFTLQAFGPSFVQTWWDEMPATGIANAEHFAVSPEHGYIFYNVGGKLYEYDMFTKQSKLMLDKGTSTITLLKFQRFLNVFSSASNNFKNKLIVGSYDAGAANGTMDIYTAPPVNGPLDLFQTYTGFGKIKGIAYRERN